MADNNEGAGMKDKTEELDLNLDTEIDPDDPFATSKKEAKPAEQKPAEAAAEDEGERYPIFALRTTANREEQVMDFIKSNVEKKNKDAEKSSGTKERLEVYSIIHPHGMRGYLFVEAKNRQDA